MLGRGAFLLLFQYLDFQKNREKDKLNFISNYFGHQLADCGQPDIVFVSVKIKM